MAKLEAPKQYGPDLGDLAPVGTYIAVCFHVHDEFGVDKEDFTTKEKYKVNQTTFYFGFIGKDGKPYKVRSKAFTLSLKDTANLPKFLVGWNGVHPKAGMDTADQVGKGAMLTVVHNEHKGKTYANLSSVAPVMDGLEGKIPAVSLFATKDAVPATPAKKEEDPF